MEGEAGLMSACKLLETWIAPGSCRADEKPSDSHLASAGFEEEVVVNRFIGARIHIELIKCYLRSKPTMRNRIHAPLSSSCQL